ncbi:MAG: hypothetical protein ACD_24C00450G0002 [uncultured bacterium]|nr:MAG: hypothetical protein ACD_24C00450G0002 [uncultured bacterium]
MKNSHKKEIKAKRFPSFQSKYDPLIFALLASMAINVSVLIYKLSEEIMLLGIGAQLFCIVILLNYTFKATKYTEKIFGVVLYLFTFMIFITSTLLFIRS